MVVFVLSTVVILNSAKVDEFAIGVVMVLAMVLMIVPVIGSEEVLDTTTIYPLDIIADVALIVAMVEFVV